MWVSFSVDKNGDRATLLSRCFSMYKGNGTFCFHLDCKLVNVRIDGVEV